MSCNKTFSNSKRSHHNKVISKFLFDKQINRVLKRTGLSYRKVCAAIDQIDFEYLKLTPRTCVVAIDTVYFSRTAGVTIFRDVTNNVILHWYFVSHENLTTHIRGIKYLESQGIIILGFILDGLLGFYTTFGSKYPLQMCQKHMMDIIRRYITRKPQLEASKELKIIIDKLYILSEKDFDRNFDAWCTKWRDFLKERTYNEDGSWGYTHKRLRSAVLSLKRYRPYLFSYQKYSQIPNTNNSLEGFNSGMKGVLRVHNGLRNDRKVKLIHYYLKEKSKFKWGKKPTHFVN